MNTINSQLYSPRFKAIPIANTITDLGSRTSQLEIYQLNKKDKKFVETLAQKVQFKKLCPNLTDLLQQRWQNIFDYCIDHVLKFNSPSYIALHNGKPCGIMTYEQDGNSIYLNAISTIPDEKGKKVPLCGQNLFFQLFKDAKAMNAKSIILDAVQDGPYNVIKKYETLGFIKDPTSMIYSAMVCNKYKINEQIERLAKIIDYSKTSIKEVNLEYTLA